MELVIPQLRGKEYCETGHFYGWLSTIAFRHAMTINRTKIHAPELMEELTDLIEEENSSELSEENQLLLNEALKIISAFKERDRQIIKLHTEDNLSFEKIARQMKLNQRSVRVWHSRSMKRIKESLKKQKKGSINPL